MTHLGVTVIPARTELISVVVQNEDEEKKLSAEGWHLHPADAVEASGKPRPPSTPANRIAELEAQIRKLEAEKTKASAHRAA
jgi:hypothetical protein